MPVDEVRAGMRGTGLTVFDGAKRSEFTAEIIGVLENSFGPRRNLVLARLDGGPLAGSGVIQGMSGSPVYIDGRLVGAVSYSLGSFPKETIAGITPIDEMLRDDTPGPPRIARAPELTLPLAADSLTRLLSTRLARPEPFAARPGDVGAVGLPADAGASYGVRLRPIATPLTLSGFTPAAFDRIASMFGPAGLAPVVGGTAAGGRSAAQSDAPLQAGDAVGVSLMQGGPVDGGHGHRHPRGGRPGVRVRAPVLQPRRVALPDDPRVGAHGAAQPADLVAHRHRRWRPSAPSTRTARAASAAAWAPARASCPSASPSTRRTGNGRTPSSSRSSTTRSSRRCSPTTRCSTPCSRTAGKTGAATYAVRGKVTLAGLPAARFEETFAGNAATVLASAYVAGPLTALVDNGLEPVTVERVDVSVTARDGTRTAELERVWLDDPRPRPGRTAPLRLAIRARDGDVEVRTVMVDLPSTARGRVRLLVADGATLAREERQQAGMAARPTSLRHLIDALNTARRNDRFYVQLRRGDAGAVVNGRRLPSLPRSVLDVLGADRAGAGLARMSTAALREWEVPLDRVVSGARVIDLDLGS